MFNSRFLFSAKTVLFLITTSDYAVSYPPSTLFSDEGLISYEDKNGTISESIMSSIRCAAKCLQDMSCNAIELCPTPSGQTCRLGGGWKNTGGTLSQATCRRFQIVDEYGGEGYIDRRFGICNYDGFQTCQDISRFTQKSGVYGIILAEDPKHVFCSVEVNRTWTVIQRRQDGSENFIRNWTDYEFGFGSPASEVWLGNKYIHQLTADGHAVLRIELKDHDGNKRYAEYNSFNVADLTDNYRIQVSGYTGDAGNSLVRSCAFCNNGMPFTTYDRDNDNYDTNCAVWSNGGWWHSRCQNSCLNGLYGDDIYGQGVNWEDWRTLKYSLKSSVMKVRKP